MAELSGYALVKLERKRRKKEKKEKRGERGMKKHRMSVVRHERKTRGPTKNLRTDENCGEEASELKQLFHNERVYVYMIIHF